MSFTEADAKRLAASVRGIFPVDKPVHVQVEVDVMDTETNEIMSIILSGRPPGLTTTTIVGGTSHTYMGNPES